MHRAAMGARQAHGTQPPQPLNTARLSAAASAPLRSSNQWCTDPERIDRGQQEQAGGREEGHKYTGEGGVTSPSEDAIYQIVNAS